MLRPVGAPDRRLGRDVAVIAGLWVLDLLLFFQPDATGGWLPQYVVPVLALLTFAPLLWRREAPAAVFIACLTVSLLLGWVTIAYRPMTATWAALYSVACALGWRATSLAMLTTAAPTAVLVVEEMAQADPGEVGPTVFLAIAYVAAVDVLVVLAGRIQGGNWRQLRDLQRRQAEAEREAVRQERARIARELHDIVAHAVTLMVLQAAGARRIAPTDTSAAAEAMQSVEEIGKQAMAEMRRLLVVLRSTGEDMDDRVPSPGLSGVDQLVRQMTDAGLSVKMAASGTPGALDPSVDLTAFRVVQEALTNIARHAGPGSAVSIRLDWQGDWLGIDVRDDGAGTRAAGLTLSSSGYGFAGLTERVNLVGGRIKAEREVLGGYRVSACLPTSPLPEPRGRPGQRPSQAGSRIAEHQQ